MNKTAVINVVGLTPDLIGEHTPRISEWIEKGKMAPVESMLPAVTCSVQATYLTGEMPDKHGIVANGWYFREMDIIKFWRQSNKLVQSQKIWEKLKAENPDFTCANLFWWYNMNSSVDYLITPRPIYRADGVKVPDIYTKPIKMRDELQNKLGQFPLFNFWGPNTTIFSSKWIADSAIEIAKAHDPTLTLIYLPHLDYNLQRIGPDDPDISKDLNEIDSVCGDLFDFYEEQGIRVILLSEYGIEPVKRPVSINRELRKHGHITVREEMGGEILIPDTSSAFAVADHQVAHIYVNDPDNIEKVKKIVEDIPGVETVLDEVGKKEHHLDHPRSGELVAIAETDSWFTYYYWLDDEKAPDFAPTVDIHTKPGYDPAELLINPEITFPKLKAGFRLLQKKLGFRYKMDLIPIEGSGVKGSHGRIPATPAAGPMVATQQTDLLKSDSLKPTDVFNLIYSHVTES
ncbi:alkaline phosphatase family protein [Rhodohalobacter sp. SW132]|uniref:alkaline phosphatase family protein n=1 Tax=Rhodohalobacter sp. SW132 TaxID=2293433 RepID=UPI000E220827|nr:nucleotide pyrophosphatase/phosphodiesterase family protein [Rhodohalobacter sp. SW132]REL37582.1 alkaline phosphatase family protein [Rhodohalobacter sp. SW132]